MPSALDSSSLRSALLSDEAVRRIEVAGHTDAGVLIPIYEKEGDLTVVFTKRREDLSRHAGEISFPGGRPDPADGDLRRTALRESHEEIGLSPEGVEVLGALPPVSTFITGYKVYPYVGLIAEDSALTPNPQEVENILHFTVAELVAGHERRRLIRRGVPVKTDCYTVRESFIWGATARIVRNLLQVAA